MQTGVRELKQNLSRLLDEVAAGATITVTDRGRPKALIVPIAGMGELERGIDEGWIRPGAGRGLLPVVRVRAGRTIAEVLAEDRDE